jgi:hypothetical protein
MARTEITYQQIVRTGLEQTYAAAVADGAKFSNDGRMFLHVKNGSGAPINVTIQTPGTVDGLAIAEQVVAVTNAEERMIGPFPPSIYNQSDGMVYADYSAVTDVTVALLRL